MTCMTRMKSGNHLMPERRTSRRSEYPRSMLTKFRAAADKNVPGRAKESRKLCKKSCTRSTFPRRQPIGHNFDLFRIQGIVGEIKFVIADGRVGVVSLKSDFGETIINRISGRGKLLKGFIVLLRRVELAGL